MEIAQESSEMRESFFGPCMRMNELAFVEALPLLDPPRVLVELLEALLLSALSLCLGAHVFGPGGLD